MRCMFGNEPVRVGELPLARSFGPKLACGIGPGLPRHRIEKDVVLLRFLNHPLIAIVIRADQPFAIQGNEVVRPFAKSRGGVTLVVSLEQLNQERK